MTQIQLSSKINKQISSLVITNKKAKWVDLGFSKEDRSTNVRRIGYVASEIVKHGGIVVVANIAPFEEDRQYNRKLISSYGKYFEFFVDTPIEVCEERDVKGASTICVGLKRLINKKFTTMLID